MLHKKKSLTPEPSNVTDLIFFFFWQKVHQFQRILITFTQHIWPHP